MLFCADPRIAFAWVRARRESNVQRRGRCGANPDTIPTLDFQHGALDTPRLR
jgi:hypothetical protein